MQHFGNIIVYRIGRLCGGAHEMSGIKIKAPLFLHGGVGGGGVGWDWWGRGWSNLILWTGMEN